MLSNEETRDEVSEMLRSYKEEVRQILSENRDIVESLRDRLVQHEELMGDEIIEVIEETIARRSNADA